MLSRLACGFNELFGNHHFIFVYLIIRMEYLQVTHRLFSLETEVLVRTFCFNS